MLHLLLPPLLLLLLEMPTAALRLPLHLVP